MKIIQRLEAIEKPFHNAVITIGNFDGVHIGHQALLHTVIEKAEAISGTAAVMTFEPHPIRVLAKNGQPPLITMNDQKAELIARAGIEVLICIPFTHEFAAIPAERFVQDILVARIGVKALVVGRDYTFGRDRKGDLALLKRLSGDLGYEVVVVDWIQGANGLAGRISSTRVRQLVMEGRMDEARKMLGRYYQVRGRVVRGRNRGGRLLGFPTANIQLHDELCPKQGIYAVTVEHAGQTHAGVANIGFSPTFDDHVFTIEVHLLDFKRDLYDETIRVNFIQRLRDEIKFNGIEALSEQIRRDVEQARTILNGLM